MCELEERNAKLESFFGRNEYQRTRLFGINGDGGLLAVANVPKKYRNLTINNLPFGEDNPFALRVIRKYGLTIVEKVENGTGLYLFGQPSAENPKGTGTGKTTASIALINAYLKERIYLEMSGQQKIDEVPAFFMKMAKFQNIFNSQFRGSKESTDANADEYQMLKRKMAECDLLVLDDIGLRGITESLQNELYEIIDDRDTNAKTTVFTSNIPMDKLGEIMSEQIISRIEGMTIPVPFGGKDQRKNLL